MSKNITLINADDIFWTADENIRLVNFQEILSKVQEYTNPDEVYLIGGYLPKDPFNQTLAEIADGGLLNGTPITKVSSITKLTNGHHNPEQVLTDLLYRLALSQEEEQSTQFSIVSALGTSISSARFLFNGEIVKPIKFILSDDVAYLDYIETLNGISIVDWISLKKEDRGLLERTAIKIIHDNISRALNRETPYFNTVSVLMRKCKENNHLDPVNLRPFILSLIHNDYLARHPFVDDQGVERVGIVFGKKDMLTLLGEDDDANI